MACIIDMVQQNHGVNNGSAENDGVSSREDKGVITGKVDKGVQKTTEVELGWGR